MPKKTTMLGSSIVGTSTVKSFTGAKYLVMVPGHAVYVGTTMSHTHDDKYWKGGFPGEAKFYTEHALAGVSQTADGPKSLLIFTGGQTRDTAGPISEAQSYWFLSNQCGWLGHDDVKGRAFTEDFARDSLENLAFGIGRFVQITGEKPADVIICGWAFKEERYRLHAEALGIKQGNLHYVGVNNPEWDALNSEARGEIKTLADFRDNPFGTYGILAKKRVQRDPFLRGDAYRYYGVNDLFGLLR